MTRYFLALWCFFAALPCGAASATPACYESAQHPAHDFAFAPHKGFSEITAITPDGMSCETVRLYNGEPLLARKFYAPLRKVYEAYARAIDQADVGAAKKSMPTPSPDAAPVSPVGLACE